MSRGRRKDSDPDDPRLEEENVRRGHENREKGKSFEEDVAELFSLLGYRTLVGYKRNDMQFDIRLELHAGIMSFHILVECKKTDRPVTQLDVNTLGVKVFGARAADKLQYQAILVSANGFAENAQAVADEHGIVLQTYEGLVRSLVDLRPNLDAAVRSFQGTPLERLYVEQEVALERDLSARKGLTEEVKRWLEEPSARFLALLGDFGCGKTSFTRRLACEMALKVREELARGESGARSPVLINLKEGGSTTVTLENLLSHHFQRLSPTPFNPQALLRMNREGYLLLIFDAFDETIAYAEPGRYLENLKQILRAAEGKAKVLLTCRSHYFRNRPEALRGLTSTAGGLSTEGATRLYEEIQSRSDAEVGYVLEFRQSQIEEYLSNAFPPPADWRVFYEQIRHTYNLENLAERPFLLEIIVKTLPRLLDKGKVTLADLYESYCELWFDHTESRLTSLIRDRRVAMALVEYLARQVWDSPESRVHYNQLFERASDYFKDRSLSFQDKERIDYEVRTALFLNRDPEGYYSFIHRSFLEFFIARTLRAGLAAGDAGCLKMKRITREVVFFLEFWPEARQIPEVAGRVLAGPYQPNLSENALLLLYLHARAGFGPLAGTEADSEPDLSRLREAFSKVRPETIQLPGAMLDGAALPGIDLASADLSGARLERADLRCASLAGARLSQASLRFGDFREGSADGADLSGADLDHLDARDASFRKSILRGADLSFARMTGTDLGDADLREVETVGTGFLRARGVNPFVPDPTSGTSEATALRMAWLPGGTGLVNSVAWSPDGRCVATGEDNGDLGIWDAASGRLLDTISGHNASVQCVCWSPDGTRLASGSYDKTVKVWDAASGRVLNTLAGHDNYVFSVAWSPDGTRLASGSSDKTVKVWDAATGRVLNTLAGHNDSARSVAWSPDGTRLASGSSDRTVKVWEAATGRVLNTLSHDNWVLTVAWSPDGTRLASGSYDKTVKVWEATTGRVLNTLTGHDNWVRSVAWSPNGTRLASGSYDNTVKLWDSANGRLLNTLSHDNLVLTVAWSADGTRLASGSEDQTVKVWDAASGRVLNTLAGHDNQVLTVAWSADGTRLASGSYDNTVKVWDAATSRVLNTLTGHDDSVLTVAWSPDGTRLASGSWDKTVKVWDSATGRLLNTLSGHDNSVLTVAWSPDGTRLASGSSDEAVKVWDTSSGRLLNTLAGHDNWVRSVAWSPDGTRLASGSYDQTVKVWEAATGRVLNTLAGHDHSVFSVAWSADGTRLASGSADKTVKVWDSATGRLLNTLAGHDSSVRSVAWSPDGTRLASGSTDRSVKLWDAATGRVLNTLRGHDNWVLTVAWSADGTRLALGLQGGAIAIWDLSSSEPRLLARFYSLPGGSGFAATPDGYVSGSPEALAAVRFRDGWALYDITDVPERVSPGHVAAALKRTGG